MARRIAASIIALAFTASSAFALTITNKSGQDETVGIDFGNSEKVETVAAGKSIKVDGCNEECGVTGIWGYSWMAKTGDTFVFDETGLKPSNM